MSLHLTVEVLHDPAYMTSPPYQMLIAWCNTNGIPLVTGWMLYVYNEDPVRAVLTVIDLDENDVWILDEDGVPVTHEVTYNPATLPPIRGYVARGGSTLA